MKKKWITYPYIIWMILFIVVPLFLVAFYGFTINVDGKWIFGFENYQRFFEPMYLKVLWKSVKFALITTVVCLAICYPLAMILANRERSKTSIVMLLFVLPMWMNFLLRTYAWMTLLEKNGIFNNMLALFGLPKLQLLYTDNAVVFGMVYNFFPFMILPIYNALRKIDKSLIEAAQDLGANKFMVFYRVIFPLSLPGVISGVTMVFMPAVTTFVIPRLLGGGQYTLIGNLIEQQFMLVGDWNFGSSLSIMMMVIIMISMGIMAKYDIEKKGGEL